jgi:hypothetical protein
MKRAHFSLVLAAALAGCDGAANEALTTDQAALSAPGGDQCAAVTYQSLDNLHALLDEAKLLGDQDVAANGVNGAYALAAVAARDSVAEAIQILDDHVAWLQGWASDGDPTTINYVEGGGTGEVMWQLTDRLQQVVHWGSISAIYHQSEEARGEMEYALQAIEAANEIHARGTRCYVDAYFP